MNDSNDTPESNDDDSEIEGVDADDLANLEVDPEELGDDDGEGEVNDEFGEEAAEGEQTEPVEATDAAEGDGKGVTKPGKDEDRLNLSDDEDEAPRKRKKIDDENELATVDDEEADLATILQEKLRSGDDLPPEEDGELMDGDDVTDGTPLLQPRRPDEEHCQQCFLLVRKSAPKCPVDHDLCPLYPSN